MNELISPKYQMKLVEEVEQAVWDQFKTYKNVRRYVEKWHEYD